MSTTSLTKKGQVTIPKDVREALSLKEKDKVLIRVEGERAVIEKVPSLLDMRGSVEVPADVKGLSWKEIERRAHREQALRVAETKGEYRKKRKRSR